ncbi:MAG TPA: isoaspartyl peptidase/L-asparaginase [Methylomirabilota bacterium]|nr:isoaspartyl peptidase/L-asparaginase [Methylomirabilota bacterium]
MTASRPSLIVHGGAWDIPDEALGSCRQGCLSALAAGWRILSRGGTAVEAVEAAIAALEDNPVFDAGIGSHLNRDGVPELDAILMEGSTLKAGAIAGVSRVRNPIRLARRVLERSEHMFLVGAGAEQFAKEEGMTLCDPEELITETERAAWLRCREDKHQADYHFGHGLGTVGAVALDAAGEIAAGTSTGGTCCKFPGRVGDSPLIGCGCYADNEAGGVSCTGWGEAIMRVVMAKTAIECLRHPIHPETAPADAAREAVTQLAKRGHGTGGLILLGRDGRPGFDFNTRRMAFGFQLSSGDLQVFV